MPSTTPDLRMATARNSLPSLCRGGAGSGPGGGGSTRGARSGRGSGAGSGFGSPGGSFTGGDFGAEAGGHIASKVRGGADCGRGAEGAGGFIGGTRSGAAAGLVVFNAAAKSGAASAVNSGLLSLGAASSSDAPNFGLLRSVGGS